jgi:hypothetical protein
VTPDDLVETPREGGAVEPARQAHGERHVVEGAARL